MRCRCSRSGTCSAGCPVSCSMCTAASPMSRYAARRNPGDAGRGGEAVGDAAGSVPPRDPVAAQQRGGLQVAIQGGQPRVDAGVRAGRRSAAADRDAVVVQGPQHRLDGAVQVRGDLRELHRRSGPAPAAAPVQPLPVHDLPPTQTLRGGPHRMRHHPGRAAASGAAGLRARTHTSSTVSTMSIVATGVPWSRVAEISGDLRRSLPGRDADPPQLPRSDGPVQHDRGTAGIRPGTPAPGRVVPDRR